MTDQRAASRSSGSAPTSIRSSCCSHRSGGSIPVGGTDPGAGRRARRRYLPRGPPRPEVHGVGSRSCPPWGLVPRFPWMVWNAFDEFHPVTLAIPLLLYAIWFLDEHRLGLFAVFAGLAMMTGELIGLTVAGLGIWYAISYRGSASAEPSRSWRPRGPSLPSRSSCRRSTKARRVVSTAASRQLADRRPAC